MSTAFDERLGRELEGFRRDGVYKKLNHLDSPQAARVRMEGRGDVLILSSNNYLGLCDLPEVIQAGKQRALSGNRRFVNVGVLGRPENDGRTDVWYTLLEYDPRRGLGVEFVPIGYDHDRLAREMQAEGLPDEFQQTLLTGWWTTCLEVLPSKERRRGRF